MKIIEDLKNPKKRSIMLLIFYGIFFFFVFLLFSKSETLPNVETNSQAKEINQEAKLEETSINSYDFKITINDLDNLVVIDGSYVDNISLFTLNNNIYYYKDKTYLIYDEYYKVVDMPYNINKLFNINELLKDEYIEYNKEYKDGRKEISYFIDSNTFYKYYYDLDSNYIDSKINIIVIEQDSIINSILINLENLGINIKSIELSYNNINQIDNIDFDINNYTYKE